MTVEPPGTREQILEEAIAAIEEGGEASVRVVAIAEQVGVAVTAIYHHFGSRDGLVESALAERYLRSLTNLNPQVQALLESATTREEFEQGLESLVRELGETSRFAMRMVRVQVVAGTAGRPGLAEKFRAMQLFALKQQAGLYQVAKDKGFLPRDLDLEAFTSLLAGIIFGRVLQDLVAGEVDDEAYNALLFKAIKAITQ